MSHHSYIERRKDLRPFIDAICGWVELNWGIGGIAFHKVQDLEERISVIVPEPLPHTSEAIKNLHGAWRMLREITNETDPVKRQNMIDISRIFLADK